jgi:hypothetical protein
MFTLHGVCTWYAVRRVPSSPGYCHHGHSYLFIGSTAWVLDMILCDSGVLDMADALPGILKGLTPHGVASCGWTWWLLRRDTVYAVDVRPWAPISIRFVGVSCRCLWKKQIRHQRLVRISNENQRKNGMPDHTNCLVHAVQYSWPFMSTITISGCSAF